jgi:hypothetical protein
VWTGPRLESCCGSIKACLLSLHGVHFHDSSLENFRVCLVGEWDGMEQLHLSFSKWNDSVLCLEERIKSLYFLFGWRAKIEIEIEIFESPCALAQIFESSLPPLKCGLPARENGLIKMVGLRAMKNESIGEGGATGPGCSRCRDGGATGAGWERRRERRLSGSWWWLAVRSSVGLAGSKGREQESERGRRLTIVRENEGASKTVRTEGCGGNRQWPGWSRQRRVWWWWRSEGHRFGARTCAKRERRSASTREPWGLTKFCEPCGSEYRANIRFQEPLCSKSPPTKQVESASRPLCGFWMVDDQQLGN